jgi:hypothetical protein
MENKNTQSGQPDGQVRDLSLRTGIRRGGSLTLPQNKDLFFIVIALLLVALYVATSGGGFPLDDSWIHQSYARNLGELGEWSFIPGQPSAASTAPLYTVLLAIGYKLGIGYQLWTHLLGALSLGVSAIVGIRLAQRLLPGTRIIGIATGAALLLAWHLIWAAASGMETMLFSMMTLIMIWLVWRELDDDISQNDKDIARRGAVFGAITALSVATRPEAALLAAIAGAMLWLSHPREKWRNMLIWSITSAIVFMIMITPYLLLNLHLTDDLLPNTSAAKMAEYRPLLQQSYPTRITNLVIPIIAGGQLLLLPGAFYAVWQIAQNTRSQRKNALLLLPALWFIGLIMLYAARLPANYQHGRYVIPALPSLLLLGVVGTYGLLQRTRKSMAGRVLLRTLVIATALMFGYFAVVIGPSVYSTDVHVIEEEMVTPAKWLAENLAPDDLLVVHDIGAVGYFAPRTIIDLAGLVSPEVIPLIGDDEALWALMQERDARYLMAFTNQLPGQNIDDQRLCFVYQSHGTTAEIAGGTKMVVYALAWDGECGR